MELDYFNRDDDGYLANFSGYIMSGTSEDFKLAFEDFVKSDALILIINATLDQRFHKILKFSSSKHSKMYYKVLCRRLLNIFSSL